MENKSFREESEKKHGKKVIDSILQKTKDVMDKKSDKPLSKEEKEVVNDLVQSFKQK